MKKYTINLSQTYTQDYTITIEVESKLTAAEIESQISDLTSEWRLARLSEEEIMSKGIIDGYVKGSFSTWDGDFEPSSDVSVAVEDEEGNDVSESNDIGDVDMEQLLKELEEEDNQEGQ